MPEKSEILIDKLYAHASAGIKKPRTYLQKASIDVFGLSMKRNMTERKVQRGHRKELQYLGRNLKSIGELVESVPLTVLEPCWYRTFLVISELYRQQIEIYQNGRKSISE